MPLRIEDKVVYPIGEALAAVGLSRSTYFRWVKLGRVADTQYKDRNGRRVFTEVELGDLKNIAQRLQSASPQINLGFEQVSH
jgi:DNA-binding transcriptional MerR regulator